MRKKTKTIKAGCQDLKVLKVHICHVHAHLSQAARQYAGEAERRPRKAMNQMMYLVLATTAYRLTDTVLYQLVRHSRPGIATSTKMMLTTGWNLA